MSCGCRGFISDFCCIGCDGKFEDHETLWETERERQQLRKSIRMEYLPLATSPAIQQETMKKLGIDGRSAEQRFLDEMRQEEESKDTNPLMTLALNDGKRGGPQVNVVIDTRKNMAPKQNLQKPEKSI
jgi:hypothetical protein